MTKVLLDHHRSNKVQFFLVSSEVDNNFTCWYYFSFYLQGKLGVLEVIPSFSCSLSRKKMGKLFKNGPSKFLENSLWKIWRDIVGLKYHFKFDRPYHFKFNRPYHLIQQTISKQTMSLQIFKGCFPQILLYPILNILRICVTGWN